MSVTLTFFHEDVVYMLKPHVLKKGFPFFPKLSARKFVRRALLELTSATHVAQRGVHGSHISYKMKSEIRSKYYVYIVYT